MTVGAQAMQPDDRVDRLLTGLDFHRLQQGLSLHARPSFAG
jgi:hypothetical protein